MDTPQYSKESVDSFNGLYARGVPDEVPKDHLSIASNVIFDRKGEVSTRYGTAKCYSVGWTIKRFFLSTINAVLLPITLDTNGNIYAGKNTTPIFSNTAIIDFVGINMFNKTFILPICSHSGTGLTMKIYNGTYWRNSQGVAPGVAPTVANATTTGNVSIGEHQFAFSFIYDSGFTTPPSPLASVNAPGGKAILVNYLPTGGTGVVARQIFATQANLNVLYYVADGLVSDNTTTTLTIDFYDTDLIDSADSLNDLLTSIPAAISYGGLDQYNGRMVVLGTNNDLVLVSDSGDAESFNSVTGYIQVPSQNDGNVVGSTFQINNLLYFTKVGIWQTSDNGNDPSTWSLSLIDGGTGAFMYGVSSITATQGHLSTSESVLLADLEGLFVFNGVVIRPSLTWKIKDLWESTVNLNNISQVSLFINPFETQIYVALPGASYLLVADYSDGLDPTNIKWAQWTFPHNLQSVSVATMLDDDSEFGYYLRFSLSGQNGLYKYHSGIKGDLAASASSVGSNITTTVATGCLTFNEGSVNVFTAIRSRITSNSTTAVTVTPSYGGEDPTYVSVPTWSVAQGPSLDYFRQINFMNEKISIQVTCSDTNGGITIKRIDVFGKPWFFARPG